MKHQHTAFKEFIVSVDWSFLLWSCVIRLEWKVYFWQPSLFWQNMNHCLENGFKIVQMFMANLLVLMYRRLSGFQKHFRDSSHRKTDAELWLEYNVNTQDAQTVTTVARVCRWPPFLLFESSALFFLQMGGGGHLVSVSRERLSGSEEGKVWPWPDHRHSARRPGQPEGGALLPQEESRWGEIPAEVRVTSDMINECVLIKIITLQVVKGSPCLNLGCLWRAVGSHSSTKASFLDSLVFFISAKQGWNRLTYTSAVVVYAWQYWVSETW